jgi:hypothetical protein
VRQLHLPHALTDCTFLTEDPFVVFELEDFLPEELNCALARSFPLETDYNFAVHSTGRKFYFDNQSPGFRRFLKDCPEWREVHDYFSDQSTIDALYELCTPHLSHRPDAERKPWRLVPTPKRTVLSRVSRRIRHYAPPGRPVDKQDTEVFLGFELSILHEGARIPPHTDTPSKLLSLLLYFPLEGQEGSALGTEFYAPKPGRPARHEWVTGMPDDEDTADFFADYETFFRSDFTARKLVGFLKTSNTWHGLQTVDDVRSRRALVINYFFNRP